MQNLNTRILAPHRLLPFLLLIVLVMLAKLWYREALNTDLYFLLKPAAWLSSLLHNASVMQQNNGSLYLYPLHVQLEKSCSGFNFAILCYLSLAVACLWQSKTYLQSFTWLFISALCVWPVTILVNSFRIYVSIYTQLLGNLILPQRPHYLIHDITGMSVHFLFLILLFHFWNSKIIPRYLHE